MTEAKHIIKGFNLSDGDSINLIRVGTGYNIERKNRSGECKVLVSVKEKKGEASFHKANSLYQELYEEYTSRD